jgi:ATPase family AAA domain-containing protein 1
MTLWDGLASANASGMPARIVVLGATNRIHDIDEAILRRMPKKFEVPLPGRDQRRRILQLILEGTKTDRDNFDLEYIARVTAGMSGSDIKEACRDAAMVPLREYLREHQGSGLKAQSIDPSKIRGIRTADFFGRMGAGPVSLIASNHTREVRMAAAAAAAATGSRTEGANGRDSDDEYEDVDDEKTEAVDG